MPRRAQKGLTLIETLVALAILAGVVLAAYAMVAQSSRFAALEQERLIASIIADNRAAEMLLRAAPPDQGEEAIDVEAAGRKWVAKSLVTEAGEDLLRVEISVTRAGDEQALARVDTLRPVE